MTLKRKAKQQLDRHSASEERRDASKKPRLTRTAGEKLVKRVNTLSAAEFQEAYVQDDLLAHYTRPFDDSDEHDHEDDSPTIQFRHVHDLTPTQLSTCLDLIDLTSRNDYENSNWGWHPRRKKREMLDDDMRYLLVRDRHDTIQGFLSFMLTHDSIPSVPVLYVYEIHLQQHLRKQGLGAHLMNVAETIARSVGVEKVMLTCFLSNSSARRFYERRGYAADICSPGSRRIRSKVVESDYVVMSRSIQ